MTQNNEKIIVHINADIEELVPGFLQNRREDVKTILDALEKGDYETIRIAGHSMKGAGGGYGFDAITDMGHCLEEAAKGNYNIALSVNTGDEIGQLRAAFNRMTHTIKEHTENLDQKVGERTAELKIAKEQKKERHFSYELNRRGLECIALTNLKIP